MRTIHILVCHDHNSSIPKRPFSCFKIINLAFTKSNLKKLGIAAANDIHLLRADRSDLKSIRRKEVLTGTGRMKPHGAMKVLAWFGDAAHDHPDDPKMKWGTHKFMLPNPVYGNW